jgi:predicted nucleic acid-binding protein
VTTVHERVLLDTFVVIDYPADAVAAHAEAAAVSTITLAELSYALHAEDPLLSAAREKRYHWIADTFAPIPFDAGTAGIYGALCANVLSIGRHPKPRRFDILIAAVAVTLGIPLITRNENDLRGIHSALAMITVQEQDQGRCVRTALRANKFRYSCIFDSGVFGPVRIAFDHDSLGPEPSRSLIRGALRKRSSESGSDSHQFADASYRAVDRELCSRANGAHPGVGEAAKPIHRHRDRDTCD